MLKPMPLTLADLNTLMDEWEAWAASKKLRKENPYVSHLIRVLWPYPSDLHRSYVLPRVQRLREERGLSIPQNFESSVQNAIQTHSYESDGFKGNVEDDLFYWPTGKHSGKWAVRHDKAEAWLRRKRMPDA